MKRHILAVAGVVVAMAIGSAQAAGIPTTVSASNGAYANSIADLNDGVVPPNGTSILDPSVVHFGPFNFSENTVFTFQFSGPQEITSFLANVDNNDDYTVTFFDGSAVIASRTILASDGVVTVQQGGVETFSSTPMSGATYVADLAFAPLIATSATFYGSNGDGNYGAGEVDFFGVPGVPEPAAWALILAGAFLFGGALRRARILGLGVSQD